MAWRQTARTSSHNPPGKYEKGPSNLDLDFGSLLASLNARQYVEEKNNFKKEKENQLLIVLHYYCAPDSNKIDPLHTHIFRHIVYVPFRYVAFTVTGNRKRLNKCIREGDFFFFFKHCFISRRSIFIPGEHFFNPDDSS